MEAVFICDLPQSIEQVYGGRIRTQMEQTIGISPQVFGKQEVLADPARFAGTRFLFSTWGMPVFSEEEIASCFPKLECVFYAAGTVQGFARPFLNRGIRVFSAWGANGIPVAEYTVAQIILANKGFFRSSYLMRRGAVSEARQIAHSYPGNYGETIGLLGCGIIGSAVAERLKDYCVKVIAFDPFLSEERAKALHVECCSLEDVFGRAQVISNHLANNAETRQMLRYELFSRMRPNAVFLNTGRGAQVVEGDLVRVLEEREDLTAVLDVTDPEPPVSGHKFYELSNCILTPHIAGSIGDEVQRMAVFMMHAYERYVLGEKDPGEVTWNMLQTMA